MIFPRNNWLIRCLVANQSSSTSTTKNIPRKKVPAGAPKIAVAGQRVLFKQLDRACSRSQSNGYRHTSCNIHPFALSSDTNTPPPPAPTSTEQEQEQDQDEKQQERLFLLNLSRICKEKKAQDSNFDQKRFVKEGLILNFGETKAKNIMNQVYGRIKLLRERNYSSPAKQC
jgi:hypothetical protein